MSTQTHTDGGTDSENTAEHETLRIEGTDRLLMQVIEDQASDLEHSWREAIQNGLDDPMSTVVRLDWTKARSIVSDNGGGVDLTEEYGEELLTNLGESSKDAEDDETIGQFGIGTGQVFAKARTAMFSGEQALLFDVKGLGLDVIKTPVTDAADVAREHDEEWAEHIEEALEEYDTSGMIVVMSHYDDETPDYSFKWDRYEDRIEKRFQYAELATATRIYVNDERISDGDPAPSASKRCDYYEEYQGEHVRAHIGVYHQSQDDLDVYSNGVHVTDIDNRGLAGVVVTEGNLDLNFARNEIQSGCAKFAEIAERLDEIRADLFADPNESMTLNSSARQFCAEMLLEQDDERFADTEIFRTSNEGLVSLEDVQSRDKVCSAIGGHPASDTLAEGYGMIVLDEADDASSLLLEEIETDEIPDDEDVDDETASLVQDMDTDVVEVTEQAESMGVHTEHERLGWGELKPVQRKKLAIARELADRMDEEIRYPDREIYFGESDVAKAWTDGSDTITITEDSTTSNAWAVFVPELYRQLVHEFAHTSSSKDDASHGRRYNERFRKVCEANASARTTVIEDIKDRGLDTVVQEAPKY